LPGATSWIGIGLICLAGLGVVVAEARMRGRL
jgi:hypothetical protein